MDKTLEKIYKASLKFLTPLAPKETYSVIVKEAIKLTKVNYGSIFLEKEGVFERVYPYSRVLYQMKARRGFISKTFKSGEPVILDAKELEGIYPLISQMGIKSILAFPLSYERQTIGVLTLQSSQKDYFSGKELDILKLYGPLASLAIINTQLFQQNQDALKTRDLFISMAAHELRTPLTTINGYIQLLIEKTKGSQSVIVGWVKEMSWEALRLTLLINELLEISRINTGKLHYDLRVHNFLDILERVTTDFRFNYPKRKLVFDNKLGGSKCFIVGDFDKLMQVVINLLSNAVKYSQDNQEIKMHLFENDSQIIFSVHDQGMGINKKDLPKVFEGFYKGERASVEGMGLGLFLAKNIIEQHHGSISIQSKLNKGTTVEIRLPQAEYQQLD